MQMNEESAGLCRASLHGTAHMLTVSQAHSIGAKLGAPAVFRDTQEPLAAPMALQKPESIAQVQVTLCGVETHPQERLLLRRVGSLVGPTRV